MQKWVWETNKMKWTNERTKSNWAFANLLGHSSWMYAAHNWEKIWICERTNERTDERMSNACATLADFTLYIAVALSSGMPGNKLAPLFFCSKIHLNLFCFYCNLMYSICPYSTHSVSWHSLMYCSCLFNCAHCYGKDGVCTVLPENWQNDSGKRTTASQENFCPRKHRTLENNGKNT